MEKLSQTVSAPRSTSSVNTSERLNEAKIGARRLFGCFRAGDAHDPETYIAAAVSILARYPVEIIRAVTEPTGLPSTSQWLPTIAEIRNECEVLALRAQRSTERERQIQQQLEARETLQITDGRPRPTYEELQRRCAEVGLYIGPKGSRLPPVDPAQIQKKYGVSKEQWDAIPNARS